MLCGLCCCANGSAGLSGTGAVGGVPMVGKG